MAVSFFMRLGQRFAAEYREKAEFAIIRDRLCMYEGLHIFVGNRKINLSVIAQARRIGCLGQSYRTQLNGITDAKLLGK